jgi:tetratricopeptide (TPR) repeat protein
MKTAGYVAAVLVAALLPGVRAAEALSEAERIRFADGLYARALYTHSATEYEAIAAAYPHSAALDAVLFRLGESYRRLGDQPAAERCFNRVFREFPESPFRLKAGFRRADLFMQAGYSEAALDLYEAVLKADPPDAMAAACFYQMGEAYTALQKPEAALIAYQQVAERFTESEFRAYAQLRLGQLAAEDDPARARAFYDAAAAPGGPPRVVAEALFQAATLAYDAGDFAASDAAYRRLNDAFPDDVRAGEAELQAAWAAYRTGRDADALRAAQAGAEAAANADDARLAEWLYLRANIERRLVRTADAVKTYRELIARCPESRYADPARFEAAQVCVQAGDFDAAVELARAVKHPGALRQDILWLLGEAYSALGRDDEAVEQYQALVRDFPDSPVAGDAAYRIAYRLQNAGRDVEAARRYVALAQSAPREDLAAQALFAAAYCHARAGMTADAVRNWAALVRQYPEHALAEEALYQQGRGEAELARDDAALDTLRELLQRYPQTLFAADAWYWQGNVLARLARLEDAETAYRKALALDPRPELQRDIVLRQSAVLRRAGRDGEAADGFEALLDTPARTRLPGALVEWLSEYRYAQGRFMAAAAAAERLAEHAEPAWRQAGWCLLGRARLAMENRPAAQAAFEQVLAVGEEGAYAAEAALQLGNLAAEAGDAVGAEQAYARALSLAGDGNAEVPIRARATAGLGRAAEMAGRPAEAARYFMTVAVLYDDADLVPECLDRAARLYTELGETDLAAQAARERQTRYPDPPPEPEHTDAQGARS